MSKKIKLDKEEKEWVESFERDEWKSISNLGDEIKKHQDYARQSLKKINASIFGYHPRISKKLKS